MDKRDYGGTQQSNRTTILDGDIITGSNRKDERDILLFPPMPVTYQ